jgi:hypothetical protein
VLCTKILGPPSLSPHLAKFCPRALSRSVVAVETIVPLPPPAVLDPAPGARHHLVPSPRARRCLNPGPEARRHLDPDLRAHRRLSLPQAVCAPLLVIVAPLPSTSTLPLLMRAIAVLFLKA